MVQTKIQENPSFESRYLDPARDTNHDNVKVDKLVGRGNEENWEGSLTKAALDLHAGTNRRTQDNKLLPDIGQPPDIIFLTATRAIPFGFALKQFWKEAYPQEPAPQFKLLDVSRSRFGRGVHDIKNSHIVIRETMETLDAPQVSELHDLRKRWPDGNFAVFDEYYNTGQSYHTAWKLFERAGYQEDEVNFMRGKWGELDKFDIPESELPLRRSVRTYGEELVPILWNAGVASRSLIRDMQLIGHLMAEEAHARELAT